MNRRVKVEKENFKVFEAGATQTWSSHIFEIPGLPAKAKCFLKERIGMLGMEVSLNSMSPGETMPFVHRHKSNEELYLFLDGEGEFQADGRVFPVSPGTCVYCEPAVRRSWRSTGTKSLTFVVVQSPHREMATSQVFDGEVVDEPVQW